MKRILMVMLTALCAVVSASAQDWAKARMQKSPRHLEWVSVKHDGREVKCLIGFPERSDKAPAVLVIHEIFGHTDWVQSVVDRLAEAGYIAIAPDLLSGMAPGGGGSAELGDKVGRVINTIPAAQLTADLDAVAAYVAKEPSYNGKLVVAGFCWGGTKTFAYATHNPNLAAALVFYGSAPDTEAMANIKAPVYGFYGGNDARISKAVPEVTEQMKAAGKQYEPVICAGAGHGFMRAGEDPTNKNADNVKAHDEAWVRVKAILSKL
jgi:carboxymethylenebutenolidase